MSNATFEFETPEGQKRAVIIPAENIKTTGPDGQPNPMMLVAAVLIQMDTRIRGLEQALEMRTNALDYRLSNVEQMFEPEKFETTVSDQGDIRGTPEVYDV